MSICFFICHGGTNSGSLLNFNDTLGVGEVHVQMCSTFKRDHLRVATQRGIACVEHMPHHSMIPSILLPWDGRRRPSSLKKNVISALTNFFKIGSYFFFVPNYKIFQLF